MKGSLVRGWIARLVLVAAALAAAVPAPVPETRTADSSVLLEPAHTPADLPSALRASLSRETVTLVSAIAADIDADGDLDIVGSDDHLSLVVFVNDGEGHLSRASSRHPRTLDAEPDGPSLTQRGSSRVVSLQTDPPTIAPDAAPGIGVDAHARVRRDGRDLLVPADISFGVPRAPPAARG